MVTKFCKLEMEHPAAALGGSENTTFFRDENSGDIFFSDASAFLYNPGDCEDEANLTPLAQGGEDERKLWAAFAKREVSV